MLPLRDSVLTLHTNAGAYANSVDTDATARNEPSHLYLHCLSFGSGFFNDTPSVTMDMSKIKDERVYLRNQGCKGKIQFRRINGTRFRFNILVP